MRNPQELGPVRIQRHPCNRYGSATSFLSFKERLLTASLDTIDVSNLNRQFLFRQRDVGKPKAGVAAAFVEKRVQGVKITPYYGAIQDKDEEYYMQFKMVICGLDSIEARRWINATLIGMVDDDNMESLKPLIDGGTEGRAATTPAAPDIISK